MPLILKEKGHSFEECLETSVKYHIYELINWLNANYKCNPVSLPTFISLSLNQQQRNQNKIKELQQELTKKSKRITKKPEDFEPDIFIAGKEGKLSSVQYLIEKELILTNK